MLSEWLENERNSMRFLNHLLCRPLRDLWTEDPPELKKRAGAARWRPTIRSALLGPALPRTIAYNGTACVQVYQSEQPRFELPSTNAAIFHRMILMCAEAARTSCPNVQV